MKHLDTDIHLLLNGACPRKNGCNEGPLDNRKSESDKLSLQNLLAETQHAEEFASKGAKLYELKDANLVDFDGVKIYEPGKVFKRLFPQKLHANLSFAEDYAKTVAGLFIFWIFYFLSILPTIKQLYVSSGVPIDSWTRFLACIPFSQHLFPSIKHYNLDENIQFITSSNLLLILFFMAIGILPYRTYCDKCDSWKTCKLYKNRGYNVMKCQCKGTSSILQNTVLQGLHLIKYIKYVAMYLVGGVHYKIAGFIGISAPSATKYKEKIQLVAGVFYCMLADFTFGSASGIDAMYVGGKWVRKKNRGSVINPKHDHRARKSKSKERNIMHLRERITGRVFGNIAAGSESGAQADALLQRCDKGTNIYSDRGSAFNHASAIVEAPHYTVPHNKCFMTKEGVHNNGVECFNGIHRRQLKRNGANSFNRSIRLLKNNSIESWKNTWLGGKHTADSWMCQLFLHFINNIIICDDLMDNVT